MTFDEALSKKVKGLSHLARILKSGAGDLELQMSTCDKDLNKKVKGPVHLVRILKFCIGGLEL